jgi:hypothetical protein
VTDAVHPESDLLWDTWLVEHDGLCYLFYIRLPRSGGPDPATLTMGAGWDAVNLAASPELLHWTERGTVLEKDADAVWLGTEMIHRSGGTFVMNYSEERPAGQQTICFPTSAADLVARHAGGAHGAHRLADVLPGAGRIIETGVRVESGRGPGLWVACRDSESMFVASLNATPGRSSSAR